MRFYTTQPTCDGGIDLHARTLSLGIVNQHGEIVLHRKMRAAPEPFLQAMAPYRADRVVCVAWTLHLVLARRPVHPGGDALRLGSCPFHERHAWGQGQERHDRRPHHGGAPPGGRFPQAYVYPAAMRATRDMLRRRLHRVRHRAEL